MADIYRLSSDRFVLSDGEVRPSSGTVVSETFNSSSVVNHDYKQGAVNDYIPAYDSITGNKQLNRKVSDQFFPYEYTSFGGDSRISTDNFNITSYCLYLLTDHYQIDRFVATDSTFGYVPSRTVEQFAVYDIITYSIARLTVTVFDLLSIYDNVFTPILPHGPTVVSVLPVKFQDGMETLLMPRAYEFGNTNTVEIDRINRESLGGTNITGNQRVATQSFEFNYILTNIDTALKLYNFLRRTFGYEIIFRDHRGIQQTVVNVCESVSYTQTSNSKFVVNGIKLEVK